MGAGHCGSTLLDLILGSHSTGFSLAEFRMISRMLERGGDDLPDDICVICQNQCTFWNLSVHGRDLRRLYSRSGIFNKIRKKLIRQFKNPYDPIFAASGKTLLVDSSKTPQWISSQLTPLRVWRNATPFLIYLQRDERAIINSYLRKYPERGIEDITKKLIRNENCMEKYFDNFPFASKSIVKYEELAQHPEGTVQRICDFLEVPFEREMLLYWNHDHHPIAGNGGTQSLIFKYRETIGEISEEVRKKINEGDKYYEEKYYGDVGLAIRLDERWKRELSAEQMKEIEALTGRQAARRRKVH